jgi:hypothetical protein
MSLFIQKVNVLNDCAIFNHNNWNRNWVAQLNLEIGNAQIDQNFARNVCFNSLL